MSPEAMLCHNAVLGISPALDPFQRPDVQTYNIPNGSYEDISKDIFQGEVHSHLAI